MTTIATDGKTISADTQSVSGFIDQIDYKKLHRINGLVFGFCGIVSEFHIFKEWMEDGNEDPDNKPTFPNNDGWSAIYVQNGKVWEIGPDLMPVRCGQTYAVGTGAGYAMGAMLAGATPAQAIKIAMKLDPKTGGKVRTMKC